jgi:isoamylase
MLSEISGAARPQPWVNSPHASPAQQTCVNPRGRHPVASINFITAHDGFTLRDLVSYNDKHNLANGEHNNDGESHNRSWNCGIEGRTQDENVLELRASQQRNFLATLMVSKGVPMLVHGDELGRTQEGNNNAYCQDSDLSWVHWEGMDTPLSEFFATASKLRRDHPTFRRRRFFEGRPFERGEGQPLPDVVWLNPSGSPMLPRNWDEELARAIGVFYNGACIGKDARNRTINDLNQQQRPSRPIHAPAPGVFPQMGSSARHGSQADH